MDSFVPDLGDFDNFLSEDSSRDAVREERSLQEGEVRAFASMVETGDQKTYDLPLGFQR